MSKSEGHEIGGFANGDIPIEETADASIDVENVSLPAASDPARTKEKDRLSVVLNRLASRKHESLEDRWIRQYRELTISSSARLLQEIQTFQPVGALRAMRDHAGLNDDTMDVSQTGVIRQFREESRAARLLAPYGHVEAAGFSLLASSMGVACPPSAAEQLRHAAMLPTVDWPRTWVNWREVHSISADLSRILGIDVDGTERAMRLLTDLAAQLYSESTFTSAITPAGLRYLDPFVDIRTVRARIDRWDRRGAKQLLTSVRNALARIFSGLRFGDMESASIIEADVGVSDTTENGSVVPGRPIQSSSCEADSIVTPRAAIVDHAVLLELARKIDGDLSQLINALAADRGARIDMPPQVLSAKSVEPNCATPSAGIWGLGEMHSDTKAVAHVSAPYARVFGSDRSPGMLSKSEYRELCTTFDRYDFVIDGIAGCCFKPNPRGGERLRSRLSPARFQMIRGLVANGGVHHPSEFYVGKSDIPRSIQRMFDGARNVVDQRNPDGSFTLLRSHRGATAEERRIEFAPATCVSWLLIELVSP